MVAGTRIAGATLLGACGGTPLLRCCPQFPAPDTAPLCSAPPPLPLVQQQVVGLEAKVAAIAEMGFGRDQALAALKRANGDEQQAMEFLLGA